MIVVPMDAISFLYIPAYDFRLPTANANAIAIAVAISIISRFSFVAPPQTDLADPHLSRSLLVSSSSSPSSPLLQRCLTPATATATVYLFPSLLHNINRTVVQTHYDYDYEL